MANPNWRKGVSANPGGLTQEARERLAEAKERALTVLLAKGVKGGKTKDEELWDWGLSHEDPDIRVKVWFRAQDYAFGSPTLNVAHSGSLSYVIEPARALTPEAWLAAHTESQRAIAAADMGITEGEPN